MSALRNTDKTSEFESDEQLLEAAQALVSAREKQALLVEDTAAHAAIITRALTDAGWEVEHVTRGSQALDAFSSAPGKIVLLDLSLPDGDGLQLLARLRGFNQHAPIIVVTATDRVTISVDAMKRGAWDYVVKDDPKATAKRIVDAVERAWQGRLRAVETRLIELTRLVETVRAQRLEAIETIVRTVCHEVSNPLTGVVALSQMLTSNDKLDDDLRGVAQSIVRSAEQVREVVDKLRAAGDHVVEFGGQEVLNINESSPEDALPPLCFPLPRG